MKEHKLKGAILPFRKFEGKLQVGSSTIRCDWLLNYWDEAEEFKYGQKYDAIIYQKAYHPEHAKLFNGIKIFDIVDPDWLHWGYRTTEMIKEVDAITCSSIELTEAVKKFTDKIVEYVPDRVDLNLFRNTKEHKGEAKKVLWFGYSHNFHMLDRFIPTIRRNNLELIVVSENNYILPSGYGKIKCETFGFTWETLKEKCQEVDFVLNSKTTNGRFKYKSDNKTVIAEALGMPVAKTSEDVTRFLLKDERIKEVEEKYKLVKEKYDILQSINQYKTLFEKIKK